MGLRGRSKCSRYKAVWYCSRECQVKHWATHKTSCRNMVQTTVSESVVEPKLPEKAGLKVTEEDKRVVERVTTSIKPVVVEREYVREVDAKEVTSEERKPKRKSLFRQKFEKGLNYHCLFQSPGMSEIDEIISNMPARYAGFRKEKGCRIP